MTTAENQIGVNINLQRQDLNNLDISNLTPLSPEVISRQATINIGTIGHVAHGKSTVVKAISGVQTVRFKNELERNITIKLERISYERLLKISKSPELLREFEAREEKKLKGLQYVRHFGCRVPSVDFNCFHYTHQQAAYSSSQERDISTSPSSGYESLNDNASNCSLELNQSLRLLRRKQCNGKNHFVNTQHRLTATSDEWHRKRPTQTSTSRSTKRRISASSSGAGTPSYKRRKCDIEYVVECIESMESINGQPVFFVKWLNYPEDQNTWESISNLAECAVLDHFIEQQYAFFEVTISAITAEIEAEIEREPLATEASKLSVRQLDEYEPLLLKCDLILLAQFRDARSLNQREPARIRKRIIEAMSLTPFYYLRKKQLKELKDWEERMNKIESNAPVSVENYVDWDVLDMSFEYIKESFPGAGVTISENPPIGCNCGGECAPMSKCCARMADNYFAYEKNGRLRIRPGGAIYECNSTCTCDMNCVNRVIQRGRNNVLCLFKTANGCGWGLRTEHPLRKGEYVCEYVGEIITTEDANERGKQYDAIGRTYLFDLDYNTAAESVYTIDAAMHGNISHFINHSCDPNLAVFPFWINNLDVNMPRLAFFTLRSIKAGEELTFDYIRTDVDTDDYTNLSPAEKVTCRCGADNCRKVLF